MTNAKTPVKRPPYLRVVTAPGIALPLVTGEPIPGRVPLPRDVTLKDEFAAMRAGASMAPIVNPAEALSMRTIASSLEEEMLAEAFFAAGLRKDGNR